MSGPNRKMNRNLTVFDFVTCDFCRHRQLDTVLQLSPDNFISRYKWSLGFKYLSNPYSTLLCWSLVTCDRQSCTVTFSPYWTDCTHIRTFILGFAFPALSNRGAWDISWNASGDIKFNVPTCVLSSMLVLSPCERQENYPWNFFTGTMP